MRKPALLFGSRRSIVAIMASGLLHLDTAEHKTSETVHHSAFFGSVGDDRSESSTLWKATSAFATPERVKGNHEVKLLTLVARAFPRHGRRPTAEPRLVLDVSNRTLETLAPGVIAHRLRGIARYRVDQALLQLVLLGHGQHRLRLLVASNSRAVLSQERAIRTGDDALLTRICRYGRPLELKLPQRRELVRGHGDDALVLQVDSASTDVLWGNGREVGLGLVHVQSVDECRFRKTSKAYADAAEDRLSWDLVVHVVTEEELVIRGVL